MIKTAAATVLLLLAGCASPSRETPLFASSSDVDGDLWDFALWDEGPGLWRLEVSVDFFHSAPNATFELKTSPTFFTQPENATWVHAQDMDYDHDPEKTTFVYLLEGPHKLPAQLTVTWESPARDDKVYRTIQELILFEDEDGKLRGDLREQHP